jgi:hypothetical protein
MVAVGKVVVWVAVALVALGVALLLRYVRLLAHVGQSNFPP